MDVREYRTIDKSKWDQGPWLDEPDKVQWPDEATGFPCLIVRGPHGAWCGYVGISESHRHYGKGYGDVDVRVHGGLTYSDKCQPSDAEDRGICHVPGPGEPDHVWWFGFDCAHAGDLAPAYDWLYSKGQPHPCPWNDSGYDEYRDMAYVKGQVRELASQLEEQ